MIRSQFHYRSPEGSTVLTTLNPAAVGGEMIPWQSFLNLKKTRYLLKPGTRLIADYSTPPSVIEEALSDDWLPVIADFYGEGDGHQGPTEFEIQMQELLIEKGYTRFTTGAEFFQDLEPYSDRFPIWDDELYLERHRGVQTTHGWIKRANREAEADLHAAEVISSVLSGMGESYPGRTLTRIWKRLCLMQFHDILPGSSIPEVYEDAREDFASLKSSTREIIDQGPSALAARVKVDPPGPRLEPVLVFYPLGWERSGIVAVKVPAKMAYAVKDHLHDSSQVFHALGTRWQPSPGSLLIPQTKGFPLDPSAPTRWMTSKMIIDATRQLPAEGGPKSWPAVSRTILEEKSPDTLQLGAQRWAEYWRNWRG